MNWALVGACAIASHRIIRAIRAHQDCKINWLIGGSATRARSSVHGHKIGQYGTSLDDALCDPAIAAVCSASTDEKHRVQDFAAFAAGRHVLCENPLATKMPEASAMIQAAQNAGLVLATSHHPRNTGSHRAIRHLIGTPGRNDIAVDRHGLCETAVRNFCTAVARRAAPSAAGIDGLQALLVTTAERATASDGQRQTPVCEGTA